MFSKTLLLIMIPGLLLAQKQNTSIPVTPNVIQQPAQQPQSKPASAEPIKKVPEPVNESKESILLPEKRQPGSAEEHFFPHPGVVFLQGAKWVGDDHLYNLTNNIDVFIEVEKTKDVTVDIDKVKIKELITSIFKKTILIPSVKDAKPPFPYFHMLIMIAPIEKGYVFYCSGRLFESIRLDRIDLDKNMLFQGITWEKQVLLVVSKEKLKDEIYAAVRDITNNFVERYRHFEDIRLRKATEK